MEIITVDKERLLKTLKKNRKEHRGMFEQALEEYRTAAIKQLDERLRQARARKKIDLVFRLPVPEDYTESYDTAIEMVKWAKGSTIDLDQGSFEQYVLNKWGWARSFNANTASYLVS